MTKYLYQGTRQIEVKLTAYGAWISNVYRDQYVRDQYASFIGVSEQEVTAAAFKYVNELDAK